MRLLKKQLEFREREIALKEKEVEWRFQAVRKNRNTTNCSKQSKLVNMLKIFAVPIAIAALTIAIATAYNILSKLNDRSIIEDSLIELGIK